MWDFNIFGKKLIYQKQSHLRFIFIIFYLLQIILRRKEKIYLLINIQFLSKFWLKFSYITNHIIYLLVDKIKIILNNYFYLFKVIKYNFLVFNLSCINSLIINTGIIIGFFLLYILY